MIPRRASLGTACRLFALIAGIAGVRAGEPTHPSEAGLAIFETPDGWRAFVSGPVLAFARSADDVLFVGSNHLAAFDGYTWRNVGVPGASSLRALAASRDGRRIWVGASTVVGHVDRNAQGEWIFTSLNPELARAGVANVDEVRHIHLDGDRVVFVTNDRVLRWNPPSATAPGRFEVWTLPVEVRLYAFSDNDTLLIYQIGVGLLRMEETGPRLWLPENSLPSRPPMVAYFSQPGGNRFAVFNDEVFRHDGGRWIRMDEASGVLRDKRALRAAMMADGRMAIGTAFGGFVLLRPDGSVQNAINLQNGLADSNVVRVWADRGDQLWIGMWTGFARLSGFGTSSLYDQRVGLETFITHKVLRPNGQVTVVTSQGVNTLIPSSKPFEPPSFTRSGAYFRQLWDGVELDGELWLGGTDGLWKSEGGNAVRERADSSGVFMLATLRALPHGLLFFEGNACKAWLRGAQGWYVQDLYQALDGRPVSTMEDRDGRLWISTLGGHILCFTWDAAARQLRPVAQYHPGHGVSASTERPVLSHLDGRIFALAENDLLALDRSADRFVPAGQFSNLAVLAAVNAADGTAYWIVRRKDLGATAPLALLRVKPGPPDEDTLSAAPMIVPGLDQVGEVISLSVTAAGGSEELWIDGERALLRLETAHLRQAEKVPSVGLRSLRVDARHLADIEGLMRSIFPPAVSRLEFAFSAGAAATTEGPFCYQTKLEGIEHDWSPPQIEPRREFTGLSAGSYAFAARAVDRIGRTGPALSYAFVIQAPWYRRPAALAVWAVAAVLLCWSGLRLRLRQLHRQAERLNRLVTERTRELSLSNTAKSEFLENISHEIRNPLNGITGLIQLLDENGMSSRQRENARALKECSESLSRVFDEVLNFSKLEYGYVPVEERSFLLSQLLESVSAVFRAEAGRQGAEIAVRLPPGFTDGFRGDEAKLKTIVSNFVANALKYAPGSPVEIAVSCLEVGGGVVDLLVEVTDHGPGVPSEEQELIFNKFVRGSRARQSEVPGNGIGLATCRAIARLLGGSVGIESQSGLGTTFFVKLPLRRAQPARPQAAPAVDGAIQPTALIVDDQHYNQIVLAGMLAQLGYATVCASDSEEAKAALSRQAFDAVFLDVELPRVKGPEIARQIHALLGEARPLLIGASANDSLESVQRCLAAGMDAFLLKPFRPETIQAALAKARERRESGQSPPPAGMDASALELYARSVPGGFGEAVETFVHVLRDEIAALEQAIGAQGGAEAVAKAAHRVRSHAAVIGASEVVQAAAKLEVDARAGQLANAPVQLERIRSAAAEVELLLTEKA